MKRKSHSTLNNKNVFLTLINKWQGKENPQSLLWFKRATLPKFLLQLRPIVAILKNKPSMVAQGVLLYLRPWKTEIISSRVHGATQQYPVIKQFKQ